jgi:hydroxymethylglutaryl-CoA reductase
VMNGIDPIVIATGNDWRAIEAGAHAYAASKGKYSPLTKWWLDEKNNLCGKIKLPLALGVVGGVTSLHPTVKIAIKILRYPNARKLAEVIACVGLAQNLSALRALAFEGIQKGHMSLHKKNLEILQQQNQPFLLQNNSQKS